MKIARDVLHDATQATLRFVPSKTTVPVYLHFLLDDRDGTLTVSGYDFEGSCRWDTGIESEDIYCTVPAKLFADDIRNIKEEEIDLKVKGNRLVVRTTRHTARFETLPGDEFRLSSYPNTWKDVGLEMLTALERCEIAVDPKKTPAVLSGVNLRAHDGVIYATGCDGIRAGQYQIEFDHNDDFNLTVPKGVASAIGKASKHIESLQISTDNHMLAMRTNVGVFTSQLIDGNYPNVGSAFFNRDLSTYTIITINGDDIFNALKQVQPFSKGEDDYIELHATRSNLSLRAESENGTSNVEIPAHSTQATVVAVNQRYLYDYVNLAKDIEITLRVGGKRDPIYLNGLDHFSYVCMPMYIRD